MNGFIDIIKERAMTDKKTIILPESSDQRVIRAAVKITEEGFADVILIGNEKELSLKAGAGIKIIDNSCSDKVDKFSEELYEMRKKRGLTIEEARKIITTNNIYFAMMMLKNDMADGVVCGAATATADVLRPALQIIKTKKGTKSVSAFFIMVVPNSKYGEKFGNSGLFIFSDAGLVENPNAEELASIAEESANTFKNLIGRDPRVAMLSYSTYGSAKSSLVSKVQEATKIVKENNPKLQVDGELQLDAAIDSEVAKLKAPESKVAGKANVLIFPDLNAGNIGYKLVQRLASAEAYGPITQGMARPVNDLSRGCSVDDIVGVCAITCVQAQDGD